MKYSKWILSIFALFLLLEISLRIFGYYYLQKEKRSIEHDKFNILCIGDSFTYGWDVERHLTYPKQLEKMLNDKIRNMHFNVFNLGIPGSNSSQHFKYLNEIINRYGRPELVIILTGANDGWNAAESNIFCLKKGNVFGKAVIFLSDLRVYKALKLISINLLNKNSKSAKGYYAQSKYLSRIDEQGLKELLKYNLGQIITLIKSHNIGLILQNYPQGDLYGETLKDAAALARVPFIDNASKFEEYLKAGNYKSVFIYDNSHPNANGYKIIAELICGVVFQNFIKAK